MILTCPHEKPIVIQVENGLTAYLHAEELEMCSILNSYSLTVNQVLAYKANRFINTPSFRAAFLVSSLARRKVYELLVRLNEEKFKQGLLMIFEIVNETPHASEIWGEMVGVFGQVLASNIQAVASETISYSKVIHPTYDKRLTMRSLDGLDAATHELDAEIDKKYHRVPSGLQVPYKRP